MNYIHIRVYISLGIFLLTAPIIFSQPYTSRDNFRGAWETPESWIPVWEEPQDTIDGYDITINGYITKSDSLEFQGSATNLIINDTLVIYGKLIFGNNNDLRINTNGILIVKGDLIISNQTNLYTDGYLIVAGNFVKKSSVLQGSFTSIDDPARVFIAGNITRDELIDNHPNYPVLNCTAPTSTPYPNSNCSYGNFTDMSNDPINFFYQSLCTTGNVDTSLMVCVQDTIKLTSSGGTAYQWTGPDGFSSTEQNPVLPDASLAMAGEYHVTVTIAAGCADTNTARVLVNPGPVVSLSSSDGDNNICFGDSVTFTAGGGVSYEFFLNGASVQGPSESTEYVTTTLNNADEVTVNVTESNSCSGTHAGIATVVHPLYVVSITSSSGFMCMDDERTLTATPSGGTFNILEGPGVLDGNVLTATGNGTISLEYNFSDFCNNNTTQTIPVNENPIADGGPDQDLKFVFETQMNAFLFARDTGEWSLISGSGSISDNNSPTSMITELGIGENIFIWNVRRDNCMASTKVKLTVTDLFIPSVITPDGNGKNDFFVIAGMEGQAGLTILDRWGVLVYSNDKYLNEWGGHDTNGEVLPDNTYFYILKFESGEVYKGSVLIKR